MSLVASLHRSLRSALVLSLCTSLLDAPLLAALPSSSTPHPPSSAARSIRTAPLTQQERTLHALNRFTFGPRPGDLATVSRIGLDRWFEQQLNPQSIDDSALDARLAVFPAMRLAQPQLVSRFPSNQLIRVAAHGDLALPADPTTRAIYTDSIAFYNEDQARKAAAPATADPAASAAVAQPKRGPRPDLLGPNSLYTIAYGPRKPAAAALADLANTMDLQPPARQAPGNQHQDNLYPQAATTALLALPPAPRVARILELAPSDLVAFRRSLSADELRRLSDGLSPDQDETLAALQGPQRVVSAEVLGSRLERDLYSDRQLEAVMTDFWLNHFNVFLHKDEQEPYLLPAYERDTIRHNALGHFETLLTAVASSPAMLVYLDNAQSIGPDSQAAGRPRRGPVTFPNGKPKPPAPERGLNENYARELLELHTLGVRCEVSKDHTPTDRTCGAGYTQADVTEVARVLSGWTVDRPALGSMASYDDRRHQPGDKHVLGTTISGSGEREGLQLLHLLATSPATARFISTKLAVRFVSDNPPPALIDRMTKSWLGSNGDMRVVLRTLFHSPEFWAPAVYRDKVKTPLEFVVSALRASDADVSNPTALVASLDRLGMPLYGMQTPNGYSWLSEPWVSTSALVTRMNFALTLAGSRLPGVQLIIPSGTSANPPTPADQERLLERSILGEPVSDRTRSIILEQSADATLPTQAAQQFLPATLPLKKPAAMLPQADDRHARTMAGLLLGSPEFQRR